MSSSPDHHLFVLIHGLWGGPHHLSVVADALKEVLSSGADGNLDKIHILKAKSFAYFRTYDGVKACGDVVLDEIFDELVDLKKNEGITINKISFVGYSLGGLIARYCVGELQRLDEFYSKLEPVFFTTFATPHLGVRFFDNSLFHYILNTLGTTVLGQSGRDLFIVDQEKLLVKLLDPDSVYYKGLISFRKRFLLANIRNDRSVPFYTLFITQYQPFSHWDDLRLKYLKDRSKSQIQIGNQSSKARIVDLKNCSRIPELEKSYSIDKIIRYLLIFVVVCFILPFWLPVVFVATCFGSIQSMVRSWFTKSYDIKSRWEQVSSEIFDSEENGSSGNPTGISKDANGHENHPIEEGFAEMTENYVEGFLALEDRLHGEKGDGGNDEATDDQTLLPKSTNLTKFGQIVKYDREILEDFINSNKEFFEEDYFADLGQPVSDSNQLLVVQNYPLLDTKASEVVLNFDQDRITIEKNLNSIPFVKLPVYVDSFNAHDGIVSRRGVRTSLRGTSTILLWCHLLKRSQKSN